jgi:ribA/ribD-fused uncharacterized protein
MNLGISSFGGILKKKENQIDKSRFSQWFIAPFSVDGVTYPTAEHWMMAKKAWLFKDEEILDTILHTPKPDAVKKLGRKVKNFDAEKWSKESYTFVVEGNLHKFTQNKLLAKFLKETEDAIIVEASPYDAIWGIALKQDQKEALNPKEWRGTNLLGFALMEVRDKQ